MPKKLPDHVTTIVLTAESEAETSRLGEDIALKLQPNDLIAISGDLGTGKSFLARAIIRNLADDLELEVPSPTYTICQEYQTAPLVLHYDLYRLSDFSELDELGWQEALETGIVIMEWPEQVFDELPPEAILIHISDEGDDSRKFEISGNVDLVARIQHSLNMREFIEQSPLKGATRSAFAADASARNYELIHHGGETHYLMDAPRMPDGPPIKDGLSYSKIAHLAEDVSAFVAIGSELKKHAFCAPKIFAHDLDQGLVLIENLGDGKIIDETRAPIKERYLASIEFLAEMHTKSFSPEIAVDNTHMHTVPKFDEGVILAETDLLLQWYAPEFSSSPMNDAQAHEFEQIWKALTEKLSSSEQSLVLRDYHSPNIIWRGNATGTNRIGLIDFQDALIGPSAYDVASLAQDARVDVSVELEEAQLDHYLSLRVKNTAGFDEVHFREVYAIMAAQRATKILGIFVRLNKRDNKPEYMAHLPRIQEYLRRSLRHKTLKEYKHWLEAVINL